MSDEGERTALIIGGGVAGTAAAMALQAIGWRPVIFESRPAGPGDAGAFLTVATNGIDALAAIRADGPIADRRSQFPDAVDAPAKLHRPVPRRDRHRGQRAARHPKPHDQTR